MDNYKILPIKFQQNNNGGSQQCLIVRYQARSLTEGISQLTSQ